MMTPVDSVAIVSTSFERAFWQQPVQIARRKLA